MLIEHLVQVSILAVVCFSDLFVCLLSPLEWEFLEEGDGFVFVSKDILVFGKCRLNEGREKGN